MPSAKDTFEPATFGAMSFAGGTWRGIGVESITLIGQWNSVIQCFSGNARLEAKSSNKRIECYSDNERL